MAGDIVPCVPGDRLPNPVLKPRLDPNALEPSEELHAHSLLALILAGHKEDRVRPDRDLDRVRPCPGDEDDLRVGLVAELIGLILEDNEYRSAIIETQLKRVDDFARDKMTENFRQVITKAVNGTAD